MRALKEQGIGPSAIVDRSDFEVGCRILTQPFFFDEHNWIPVPASWSPNIVSFKTYNTGNAEGLALWEAVRDRLSGAQVPGMNEAGGRFGEPHLIRPRLGQGAFRVLVTDVYRRRCAVTQERTLPALEAAHIRPYSDGGAHETRNGLLLRRDIHSLFDAGYVTVSRRHQGRAFSAASSPSSRAEASFATMATAIMFRNSTSGVSLARLSKSEFSDVTRSFAEKSVAR